jgi:hypothetical protein
MVDTPVGKKCRPCAQNRTHLSESSARQVVLGLLGAMAVAIPASWLAQQIPILLLAFPYGWLVGETAFRAAGRSRSLAVQVATAVASVAGGVMGALLPRPGMADLPVEVPTTAVLSNHWLWIFIVFGTLAAVSRVRYL